MHKDSFTSTCNFSVGYKPMTELTPATLFEIWLIIFSASTYWLLFIHLGLEWFIIFSNFHLLSVVHILWFEIKCASQFHHSWYDRLPHWTSMHGICQLQRWWKCFKIWGWECRKLLNWTANGGSIISVALTTKHSVSLQLAEILMKSCKSKLAVFLCITPFFCWFKCSVQDKVMEITMYTVT